MADALATLLVQEGAVSLEALARAQALQREQGGSLDTALLELGLLGEEALVSALARATGLQPAPVGSLLEPDLRSRRVFPAKVAERHGLAPFRLDGKELHLLATWPIDVAALDEISFMLSLHLVPHVAAEWRIWELRQRVYDSPLPERFARLVERLRRPGFTPVPRRVELPAAAVEAEHAGPQGASPGALPVRPTAEPSAEPPSGLPPAPAPGLPLEPAPGLPPGPPKGPEHRPAAAHVGAAPPPAAAPPTARPRPLPQRADPTPAGPSPRSQAPAMEPLAAALALAVEQAEAAVEGAELPSGLSPEGPPTGLSPEERLRPPRWSLAAAREALATAATRDDAVAVLLRYARDFFEHAALLAVTRGRLHGHDALGLEPSARARARAVSLPSGERGIVPAVLETGGPYLGPPGPDPLVDALLAGLGRATPRTMLLYPVAVRERVVCLLYADNGEAPVSPRRLGDLLLLASELGAAFLRILRAAKAPPATAAEPSAAGASDAAPARPEEPPLRVAVEEPEELAWESLAPPADEPAPADLPPLRLDLLPDAGSTARYPALALDLQPPAVAVAASPGAVVEEAVLQEAVLQEVAFQAGAVPETMLSEAVRPEGPPEAVPLEANSLEAMSLEAMSLEAAPLEAVSPEVSAAPEEALSLEGAVAAEATPAEPGSPGPPDPREAFTPPPAFDAVMAVQQLAMTRRGSTERARLLAQLALHGPEAAAALVAALPGPVDARGPGGEEAAPIAERGPVLEALCVLDIVATPYLVAALTDADPRRRRHAALLLGQVGDPAAFLPLADRVFDADPSVAAAALAALAGVRGHPDFRPVLERLRRALHGEAPRPAFAARALVELGDGGAVGQLISLLVGPPGTVAAAQGALEALTARRLGRDPAAWAAWWEEHRGRRRTDWLFEALTDPGREVRIAAADALRALGPSPIRFFADAPEPERRRAAGEWREWFESHGLGA